MAKKTTTTGHKNDKAEETRLRKMSADFNRLSGDTISKLCSATHDAMKTLQGDGSAIDAVTNSELYCELFTVSAMACNHYIHREKAKHEYAKMEWMELLKELYLRLQMYHHYGECKGRELPGIAWHMEPTGVFAITLKDCAVNMEYDVEDERCPDDVRCRLFAVALNLPLQEREDPESKESHLCGEFDEFVTFTCQFKESGECRDVYPSHYTFTQAMRNILAGFDMIGKMQNEEVRGKR